MSRIFEKLYSNEVDSLKHKVEKLNKRAKKIGCPEMSVKVIKEYTEKVDFNDAGYRLLTPRIVTFYDAELVGEPPKYDGWEFLATVVGYPNGKNMLKRNPFADQDIDISQYREAKSYCDHCRTTRFRKYTYLIINEEKEIFQVGSTCIKDFLGHTVNVFGAYAKILGDIEDMEIGDCGPRPIPMYLLSGFLPLACEVISQFGFVSKKKAYEDDTLYPTSSLIQDVEEGRSGNPNFKEYRDFEVTERSKKLAEKITEWGESLKDREYLNDYLYSISLLFETGVFDFRSYGLATSIVFAYKNEMGEIEKKKTDNKKPSEYVSEVGQRIEVIAKIIKVLPIESDFGGCDLYLMEDLEGNSLNWYSSGSGFVLKKGKNYQDWVYADTGDIVKFVGTVKAHKDYKGIKQTQFTRCTTKDITVCEENK